MKTTAQGKVVRFTPFGNFNFERTFHTFSDFQRVDNSYQSLRDSYLFNYDSKAIAAIIQTEAERRRREAGVKQSMEIRVRSCMYVGGWVCMVFGIISRTKARSATNKIPKCRSRERALLRHHIIGV